jgi:flagellar export protein FliJ
MKRFTFRLDRVLDYRNYLVKKAQGALARAKNEYRQREKRTKRLYQQRVDTTRACVAEGVKGLEVARYRLYQDYLQGLNGDIEKANISLKEVQLEVTAKETSLLNASVKKKALETLKDFQYKKYKESSGKEEQKALDELAIIERNRKT